MKRNRDFLKLSEVMRSAFYFSDGFGSNFSPFLLLAAILALQISANYMLYAYLALCATCFRKINITTR